ncbi:MAG: hypothetical protein OXI55_00065 [Gammaproteobacteria bacterium]|nr:hypothetical protein [Gammaproteobacteria bacterium]
MVTVADDVPEKLRPAASAALAWINEERGAAFEVTGVVDADAALAAPADTAVEFGLVLCEDEMCLREQVRVEPRDGRFQVSAVEAAPSLIPPLLDPPQGVRRDWLDRVLGTREFAVLLVYRGLW